jgi:hypothetical protein
MLARLLRYVPYLFLMLLSLLLLVLLCCERNAARGVAFFCKRRGLEPPYQVTADGRNTLRVVPSVRTRWSILRLTLDRTARPTPPSKLRHGNADPTRFARLTVIPFPNPLDSLNA